MTRRSWLLLAAVMGMTGFTATQGAWAQGTPPTRLRGTLASVQGNTLAITERSGDKISVMLAPNAAVSQVLPAKITDVKDGSYIGTAAMPQADGSLVALEIQLFPEPMRGVGEGNRPWDLQPGSSMTNGTAGAVSGMAGRTLTLSYKGGEKKVSVPDGVPVITYANGSLADLTPGASIMVNAMKQPDGSWSADRVWVGKGVKVPM